LTKITIFDQNYDFPPKIIFLPKCRLTFFIFSEKIFDHNLAQNTKNPILQWLIFGKLIYNLAKIRQQFLIAEFCVKRRKVIGTEPENNLLKLHIVSLLG